METERLWERLPSDTSASFRAFAVYRDLGPERSLSKAAETLGKHPGQLKAWSVRHGWQGRVLAFDAHEDELQQKRIRARRRRALDRRLDLADKAFDKVEEALDGQDTSKWRAGDLARVLAETAKLEDTVIGSPSQRSAGGEPITADDFEHLADEEIVSQLVLLRRELDSELVELQMVLGRVPPDQRDPSTSDLFEQLSAAR